MVVVADPSVLRGGLLTHPAFLHEVDRPHSHTNPCAGIPEFFESELSECLAARTESLGKYHALRKKICESFRLTCKLCAATFRELGPPDLCHIVKTNPKTQVKDVREWH